MLSDFHFLVSGQKTSYFLPSYILAFACFVLHNKITFFFSWNSCCLIFGSTDCIYFSGNWYICIIVDIRFKFCPFRSSACTVSNTWIGSDWPHHLLSSQQCSPFNHLYAIGNFCYLCLWLVILGFWSTTKEGPYHAKQNETTGKI